MKSYASDFVWLKDSVVPHTGDVVTCCSLIRVCYSVVPHTGDVG